MQGKGPMKTYWLTCEPDESKRLNVQPINRTKSAKYQHLSLRSEKTSNKILLRNRRNSQQSLKTLRLSQTEVEKKT